MVDLINDRVLAARLADWGINVDIADVDWITLWPPYTLDRRPVVVVDKPGRPSLAWTV